MPRAATRPHAGPSRTGLERVPERVEPMLARLSDPPDDPANWAYETKWDGVRALVYWDGTRMRVTSRAHNDITDQFPELDELATLIEGRPTILDGELVALDERGNANFQRIQSRMGLRRADTIAARAGAVPATLVVFDLLYLDDEWTIDRPWLERRRMLEQLALEAPHVHTSPVVVGELDEMLRCTRELGLEGVMAKRTDAPYRPGRRSGEWLKIKHVRRQEFVIGGFTAGAGTREGTIGAVLVGYYDRTPGQAHADGTPQRLVYAGSVGTGFDRASLRKLTDALEPLKRSSSPFDVRSPGSEKPVGKWQAMGARGRSQKPQQITFVEPRFVVEVGYAEFTRDGTLRHPSFKGLRCDTEAVDVVLEQTARYGEDGERR